jgi:hypothetical protein
MNFTEDFKLWLECAFKAGVPTSVVAFAFNLYEPALIKNTKFAIEIIGSGKFSPDDSDWACDEIWRPEVRQINIPISFSTDNWQDCLRIMRTLLTNIIAENNEITKCFYGRGVGLGFVDGELQLISMPIDTKTSPS